MNYDDFINKIKGEVNISPFAESLWHFPDGNKFGSRDKPKFDYILNKVEIGGASGGTCWGDVAQYYSCPHNEKEFVDLSKILEKCAPSISFIEYKKLTKLIYSYEDTVYEYYGNYTQYRVEYIKLEELFGFLVENNLI